jgi:glutamate/aspartate transport system permease protein
LHWGLFFEDAPFGGKYYHWLMSGTMTTVEVFVCSWILALTAGTLFGVLRTVPGRPWRMLGTLYAEIFRNFPLITQLFIWYLVVPEILPFGWGAQLKALRPHPQFFIYAVLCLGFFTGARLCEQVRGGIESLSASQRNAGLALGLTLGQTYRHILMPNAFRIILPPLTSEMLNLIKNSAVVSAIGLLDLVAQAYRMLDYSAYAYESFIAITVIYVVLNFTVMGLMRIVSRRTALPGPAGHGMGRP